MIALAARESGRLSNFKGHILTWMELEVYRSGRVETTKPLLGLVFYEPGLENAALLSCHLPLFFAQRKATHSPRPTKAPPLTRPSLPLLLLPAPCSRQCPAGDRVGSRGAGFPCGYVTCELLEGNIAHSCIRRTSPGIDVK